LGGTDGDEAVEAEGAEGAVDRPVGRGEAEGAGELVGEEAGGDADIGVVKRGGVRAEKRREGAEDVAGKRTAGGFAGDDHAGAAAEGGAEGGELGGVELMEDEIAGENGVGGVAGEIAEVGAVPDGAGRPGGRGGPEIERVDRDAAAEEARAEFAGAGAELEDAFAGMEERREGAGEPAMIAEDGVEEAEVAAVVPGDGMIRREGIENLGFDGALHGEGESEGESGGRGEVSVTVEGRGGIIAEVGRVFNWREDGDAEDGGAEGGSETRPTIHFHFGAKGVHSGGELR
jgi:hypothetical protein